MLVELFSVASVLCLLKVAVKMWYEFSMIWPFSQLKSGMDLGSSENIVLHFINLRIQFWESRLDLTASWLPDTVKVWGSSYLEKWVGLVPLVFNGSDAHVIHTLLLLRTWLSWILESDWSIMNIQWCLFLDRPPLLHCSAVEQGLEEQSLINHIAS